MTTKMKKGKIELKIFRKMTEKNVIKMVIRIGYLL